ncbi:hypothetical protein ES288_D02G006200v1 [Gossypium darwinii]|uniref:Uncharacterized protein n=1 Tax=Gossypium darwinii TaxID=34276 RepID=A0A5D2D7J4_GOSDA|nr:hypothetical protein ES288_D02G006200v1 [Gossypium darwinii]
MVCRGERCQKNPTDALTKASLPDDSSSKEGPSGSRSRPFKLPVIISIVKKKPEKKEEKLLMIQSIGLLSLCQLPILAP